MSFDYRPSDEALERITSAKLGDIAFSVRRIVGQSMLTDDVNLLARALYDIQQGEGKLTKAALIGRLIAHGRSRDKAEQLTAAILR